MKTSQCLTEVSAGHEAISSKLWYLSESDEFIILNHFGNFIGDNPDSRGNKSTFMSVF